MSLEKDFQAFALQSKEFQGKVIASLENLNSHVVSVSGKADTVRKELNDHKDMPNAHGLDSARKSGGQIVSWLALAISALGAFFGGKHQ